MNQAHESLKLLGRFLAEAYTGPERRAPSSVPGRTRVRRGMQKPKPGTYGYPGEEDRRKKGRRRGERSHRQGTDATLKALGADKWDPNLVRGFIKQGEKAEAQRASSEKRSKSRERGAVAYYAGRRVIHKVGAGLRTTARRLGLGRAARVASRMRAKERSQTSNRPEGTSKL